VRAAIYLRVSTEEQRDRQSIATQRDFAERHCAHLEILIVDFYADDGVSGTVPLDQRPQGARMFKDARAGKFDAVLVYKLDRLGRESLLILQAVQQFQALGVPVKSMTESIEADTPEGEFNLTILSGVATLERKNILRRSAEGIGRLVREGAWVGGVAPYGYRVKGRHREARLVVSDTQLPGSRMTESDVIRLVFRMAGDEGKSCLVIADALNQLDIPAALCRPDSDDARGKRRRATAGRWRDSRIQYILRNPTYKGVHLYGKRPKKPGKKCTVVERPVAAIVDAELWERAQETLRRNRLFSRRNTRRTYMLRGLIKCAHCGWTYVGTVYTSAGRAERPYYVCGGRHKGRKIAPDPASRCRGMAIPGDIDDVIWADVDKFVRNPGPVL
jgi:site-specific DNA recombinase